MTGFDVAVVLIASSVAGIMALYVRWESERFDEIRQERRDRHPAE